MTAADVRSYAVDAPPDAPEGAITVAPPTLEAAATIMEWASVQGKTVLPWGGGSHQPPSAGLSYDVTMLTAQLDRVIDWQPEDLTLVVQAGARVGAIEEMLAAKGQTAVLPESGTATTIGGTIAAGASGYRRLRYGPTRDRVLQVRVATGDGRVVTAGGRVVKNVTGYDIPRLMCGSFGSLGVIGEVCLKLWPLAEASATVAVESSDAFRSLYRPLATLETESTTLAFLAGTQAEVEAQCAELGGLPGNGLDWPAPMTSPILIEIRVPSPFVAAAVGWAVDAGAAEWRAQHGVGIVKAGFVEWRDGRDGALRSHAESVGGAAVISAAPHAVADPWGAPPSSLAVQRRVKEAFDPRGVMVPGRLPGGL